MTMYWISPGRSPIPKEPGIMRTPGQRDRRWAGSAAGGCPTSYISVAAGAGPFTGSPVECSTASEVDCRDNELGYMFYQNLSGTASSPLFPTLESGGYWSGTEFDSFRAWDFEFFFGSQGFDPKSSSFDSWAVHSGNVVPVPAAVWLFGSGLIGLFAMARRRLL